MTYLICKVVYNNFNEISYCRHSLEHQRVVLRLENYVVILKLLYINTLKAVFCSFMSLVLVIKLRANYLSFLGCNVLKLTGKLR